MGKLSTNREGKSHPFNHPRAIETIQKVPGNLKNESRVGPSGEGVPETEADSRLRKEAFQSSSGMQIIGLASSPWIGLNH